MNYTETKKELDRIRNEYGCKGEMIFRTALQYIVEYGQNKFKNDKWVAKQLILIDGKHDEAEVEGKTLWIGRNFEKALVECAAEIAKVDTYDLLIYIQKEVWLSNKGGIDYSRAIELLKNCIGIIVESHCDSAYIREDFETIGFDDEELIALGCDWVMNEEDELY